MDIRGASPGGDLFPHTQWTLVNRLRQEGSPAAERAMEEICRAYWRPLYVYARRFGLDEAAAKDTVQDLFLRLIDGNRAALADPARGRLRTFLLSALKNVMANNYQRESAAKRGGGKELLSLDMKDAEGSCLPESEAHTLSPDEAFDRKWVLELLSRARSRLRQSYASDGKEKLFDVLAPGLLDDQRGDGTSASATALNLSEGAVKTALHRLRTRFRETLVSEIRDTVDGESEVRAEVGHLLNLFSGPHS